MESIRLPYKEDAFGNPVYARVAWSRDNRSAKAIAIIYHMGGLMVGSDAVIPQTQVHYLANKGAVVVIPNYRLAPQVTGKEAFGDSEDAFDWSIETLPGILKSEHNVDLQTDSVVTMGHSSGGTLALHLGSCRPVKAVTAFYPSLFMADKSTSAHQPFTAPPFGQLPDFHPNNEEWALIAPKDHQVSEVGLAVPGTAPSPRSRWQAHLLKNGEWMETIQPDGDFEAIDPMTRITSEWPPVMIIQGEADNIPGGGLELVQRAEREMKAAGVKEVRLVTVPGELHLFDMPPSVGTSDLGPKWQAAINGLDWLVNHV